MNFNIKNTHLVRPDAAIGAVAAMPEKLPDPERVLRILVIKLRHFGDVLLITPLLSTLKLNYPHALIDVLVYGGTEAMLAGNNSVYVTYTVDRDLKHQGIKAQYRGEKILWNELSTGHYDLIINLSDQWRAAFYCLMLKPTFSIGFRYPKRNNALWRLCHSALVDTRLQPERHTVLNNLSILDPLGLREICTDVTMAYRQTDREQVDALCRRYGLTKYILIQPTARWAFKNWSADGYSALINHLVERGETVVLTGGRSEEEFDAIKRILEKCRQPEKIVNLAGKLDLPEVAVLIERATLFVGVDSAPMHMASALKNALRRAFRPEQPQTMASVAGAAYPAVGGELSFTARPRRHRHRYRRTLSGCHPGSGRHCRR